MNLMLFLLFDYFYFSRNSAETTSCAFSSLTHFFRLSLPDLGGGGRGGHGGGLLLPHGLLLVQGGRGGAHGHRGRSCSHTPLCKCKPVLDRTKSVMTVQLLKENVQTNV